MDEIQLEDYIKGCPKLNSRFRGIFSRNDFPKNPSYGFYIVNTDPDYLPGRHWVCVYILADNIALYFDSLGNQPMAAVVDILLDNGITYKYTNRRIQALDSTVCGDYCLIFAYIITEGYDFASFMNLFGKDYSKNDVTVKL